MFLPIKLKKFNSQLNSSLINLLSDDANYFNNCIQNIRFGNFFKTSSFNRLIQTYNYIISLKKEYNFVADIGSSDGSSSLDLTEKLNFNKFFFLDKYHQCNLFIKDKNIYLFDDQNNLHMVETNHFIFYLDPIGLNKNFFNNFLSLYFKKIKIDNLQKISFLNPIYKKHKKRDKIIYEKFDLFDNNESNIKFDLLFISNLLNKFHKNKKIINILRKKIDQITNEDSLIVMAENSSYERSTIYLKNKNNYNILKRINGGSLSENIFQL